MSEQKHVNKPRTATGRTEAPTTDVEGAIVAGGDIVGTTVDDELLVEGPNSK